LGAQFARLERTPPPRRRPSPPTALALAAALVALLAAVSLTPPGRAIAGKLGELVGIGDEPTGVGGTSVVIGVGEGPSGSRYEIFAFTELPNTIPSDTTTTCIGLNVPDSETGIPKAGIQEASCLTDDGKAHLERTIVNPLAVPAPSELGLEEEIVIQGLARRDVASVELEYEAGDGRTRTLPVQFFSLDESLGESIGSDEEAGFFISLIPSRLLFGDRGLGQVDDPSLEEAFSRLRLRALSGSGSALVDSRYTDLPLPGWWKGVLMGIPGAPEVRQVPPPAMIREANRAD
jgi:hypothetical protein